MSPQLAAHRFACSFLLGAALGVWYGFLRPLRKRHRSFSDLLFLGPLYWAWVYLSFAICRGDIRVGYFFGLLSGVVCWELTAGWCLRPVFSGIWKGLSRIWEKILLPAKKFRILQKFCLHLGKNGLQ